MRLRDLFLHVAVFVLAGAIVLWWMQGRQMRETAPPVAPPDAWIAPDPGDLPGPRGARPRLTARLTEAGFAKGDAVFIRIFKSERQLEVWLKRGPRFELFETYPICAWSGDLGPKVREGDGQSPEGFYEVGPKQLNPNSAYHLAFNLGFPNAYDRALGRTGSALMVHGACASIGCYAMTDSFITEIYALVEAALGKGGQPGVKVHVFPFRMTPEAMTAHAADEWAGFWRNLKAGYDAFEATGVPPAVFVCGKGYVFDGRTAPAECKRIEAW